MKKNTRSRSQFSGLNGIAPLVDAIRAIPTASRFDEGKALSMFVQTALCTVMDCSKDSRFSQWIATRIDHQALGFIPFVRVEAKSFEWELPVIEAYMQAVKDNEPFQDVLGAVHAEFMGRFGGNGLGQHFTPPDLADLMGVIAADHFRRHPKQGVIRIGEPCCGAGSLVLAQIRQLIKLNGRKFTKRLALECNDIDPLCSAMTALQLMANQFLHVLPLAKVEVTVGNTLTMNMRMGFQSIASSYLESHEAMNDPLSLCFRTQAKAKPNVFGGAKAA